ncbi:GAF and ANTAR domain-containing protein [Cellulomonas sp. URHE0023]|uniref:GAF and ANTAR domain-containing protein n=1 Tax=Cellulomonas sp. URHE0023 TaxID=1380354 RepID=UPI0004891E81|nr:GAF and ANTAR domain-containing protein [Cellulomonas sp. URHE0023]
MNARATVLAALAATTARAPANLPLPERLCRACVEVLGADGGAITLASTLPERLTLDSSNGTSARIEDLQDVLGEGPGQDAYRRGTAVVAHVDGIQGGPFPMFTELAGDIAGPVTVWAIPMHPGGATIGVITLYRVSGDLLYSVEDAQFLADAVGAALLDDSSPDAGGRFAKWSDRARVHQAVGMTVAQLAIEPDDALAILRAHAFAEATTLDAIAIEVVERRLDFRPGEQDVFQDETRPQDSSGNEET